MCKHFDLKILQASGLEGVSVEPVRHIDVLSEREVFVRLRMRPLSASPRCSRWILTRRSSLDLNNVSLSR